MKSFKFLPLFLAFLLLLGSVCAPAALAVQEPSVSAPSAIVLERRSGTVVYAKNADKQVYPASITKILTVLLAVEAVEAGQVSLTDEVTASATAMQGLSELGSTAGILAGETMTLEQLLYCAMLSSANEACNIIAEHLSGSVAAFLDRMNYRAQELGCTASAFANTHGLPNNSHYTTAEDFSRIALEASRHPLFMTICGTAEYELPATNKSGKRQLKNSNALLCSASTYGSGHLYEGASGMKTGHTTAAGYCLAATAERSDMELLVLVFGCAGSDACFQDSTTLLNWVFNNFSFHSFLTVNDRVGSVPVQSRGSVDAVELCPAADLSLLLPKDADPGEYRQEITVNAPADGSALPGPLSPDAVLGKVTLWKGATACASVDLIPASSSILVMDRSTGDVLYSRGLDNRVYPADTTKIMTALLAVEDIEAGKVQPDDLIAVTDAISTDLGDDSSLCGLQPGETLTLESLLYCMMLASGDDAANAVAVVLEGSVPAFVERMNRRATELGCTATHFTNVHGAFDREHYTSVRDFSKIALAASSHEMLMDICSTVAVDIPATELSGVRALVNTNPLLSTGSVYGGGYRYEGANGMKTGYNRDAGYALVSTAARDGVALLSVAFGGFRDESGFTSFADTVALFDWIFENYSYQEILPASANVASVDIAMGSDADYVNIHPATSIVALVPNTCTSQEFRREIRIYALENGTILTAPISSGQVIGEMTLYREEKCYGTVKLIASSSVELSRAQYIRSRLRETTHNPRFFLIAAAVILFFGLYLVWVIVYRVRRIRHLRAVRAAEKAASAVAPTPAPTPMPKKEPRIILESDLETLDERSAAQKPAEIVELPKTRPAAPAPKSPAAPPTPPAPAADPTAEKTERDYFEEFFRPKK